MKLKILLIICLCCFSASLMAQTFPAFSGGDGTENNPFLISTKQDLWDLAEFVNADTLNSEATKGKYFKQIEDIEFNNTTDIKFDLDKDGVNESNFEPIGAVAEYYDITDFGYKFDIKRCFFSGNYDGNMKIIEGIYMNRCLDWFGSLQGIGLFGCIINAEIKNVSLSNIACYDYDNLGTLAGYATESFITNCSATGVVTSLIYWNMGEWLGTGGLIGTCIRVTMSNCKADVTVNCKENAGGLIGYNDGGKITECYALGDVIYDANDINIGGFYIGGLIGYLVNYSVWGTTINATISKCYAKGNVIGKRLVGGFIGSGDFATCNIINCYARGNVIGEIFVSGFIGHINDVPIGFEFDASEVTIANCYSTGNVIKEDTMRIGGFWDFHIILPKILLIVTIEKNLWIQL